jgi:predicted phosphoadenosine phosphosulfate sulfurtransferase
MEMEGMSHSQQRIAPPYGTQPMKELRTFRTCFPDVWDKIVHRVPGANTAALYGNSELYASGRPEKPEGISWPDYLKQLLAELPSDSDRAYFSNLIRTYITDHIKRTNGGPIAPAVYHPDTGLSWDLLAKIVIRRDNKNRISPSFNWVNKDKEPQKHAAALLRYEQACKEYNAELAGLSEGGTRY